MRYNIADEKLSKQSSESMTNDSTLISHRKGGVHLDEEH